MIPTHDVPGLSIGTIEESGPDDPMTPAEFRMVREAWGWQLDQLAAYLVVDVRTVRRWEQGQSRVPTGVREAVELLERHLNDTVAELAHELRDASTVTLSIPARDAGGLPAATWRAIAYRVAEQVPGLSVVYGESS